MPIVGIGFLAQRKWLSAPGSTPKNFLLQPVSAQTDQPLCLLFLLCFCLNNSPGTAPEQQLISALLSPEIAHCFHQNCTVMLLLRTEFSSSVSSPKLCSRIVSKLSQISPKCSPKIWIKSEQNRASDKKQKWRQWGDLFSLCRKQ